MDFADYWKQAILEAHAESQRLKALAETRPLRESDYKKLDGLRGRLLGLDTKLIHASDESEMAEIARKQLRKR